MKTVLFPVVLGFLVILGCVLSSDIYKSINWAPQNPLFTADGEKCDIGARQLKVRLQSKVTFICPNPATVLQTSSYAVQEPFMFENLWLLYNKTAFDECDASLDPNKRRLLTCNKPSQLTYSSVTFAEYTAEINGLTFNGGQTYYFVATSSGSALYINATRGGHCSDASKNVYMKLEVYVCKRSNQTYQDPKCRVGIGVVQCPSPNRTHPTQPTFSSTVITDENSHQNTSLPRKEARTVEDKELKTWKFLAIGAIVLAVVLIVVILALVFCRKIGKKTGGLVIAEAVDLNEDVTASANN